MSVHHAATLSQLPPLQAFFTIVRADQTVVVNGGCYSFGAFNLPAGIEIVAWAKPASGLAHQPHWQCCPLSDLVRSASELVEQGINDLGLPIPRISSPNSLPRVARQRPGLLALMLHWHSLGTSLQTVTTQLASYGVRGRAETQAVLLVSAYRAEAQTHFRLDPESPFFLSTPVLPLPDTRRPRHQIRSHFIHKETS